MFFVALPAQPTLVVCWLRFDVIENDDWHGNSALLQLQPQLPFERGEESFSYNQWFVEHVPLQYAAQAVVHQWLESFKEFPPRQKSASA